MFLKYGICGMIQF